VHTFIIRRILIAIPLLWAVLTLTFFGFRLLIPGDPVDIMLFGRGSAADKARLRHELGYDQPLITQYWHFIKGAVHFDFGNSVYSQQSVFHEIMIRYPTTLKLAGGALLIACIFGFTGGILSAVFNRSFLGGGITSLAVLGFSIPEFVLGTMMGVVFGVQLGWLPVAGEGGLDHWILPCFCLALGLASGLTRLVRATMLDVMDQDYVRTARAKGVRKPVIIVKHVLRNALLPVVTLLGLSIAALLGGAIIIENVFALQGLGTLALGAVSQRDFPVVEGTTFLFALILITANLVVDILYAVIDPRIHYS
jgi:ABC-type dipeptide/oligopeptide/nickel transport system permease component